MPSTRSKSTPSDTATSNTMKTTKKKSSATDEDAAAKERGRQYYEKLLLKQEQMKQKKCNADFKKPTVATGSVSSSASTKPRRQQQYPKRTTHGASNYAPKSSKTGKTPRTMMEKVYQDMLKLEEREAAEAAAAAAAAVGQEKHPTWSPTSWTNPFMTSTRRGAAASSSTSNGTTPMNWGATTSATSTAASAAPLFPNFMKSPTTTVDTNTFMSSLSSSSSEVPFVPQHTYQQPRQRPPKQYQVHSTMNKTAPSSQKQKISPPTYHHHYENKKTSGTSPWWYRPLNTIIDVFVCLILYTLEMKYHLWSTIGMLLIRWIISGLWKCITYPIRQQHYQQSHGDTTGSSIINSMGYMLFHVFTILLILGVGCMIIVSRFNNNKNINDQEDEDDVDEAVQSDVDELQNMVYDELITIQQQQQQLEHDTNISIHILQDRIFSQLFMSVGSDEDTDYHRKNNQYWINTVWPRVLAQLLYCDPNVIVSHGGVVGTENDTGNTTYLRWNCNNDHGTDGSILCNKKRKH